MGGRQADAIRMQLPRQPMRGAVCLLLHSMLRVAWQGVHRAPGFAVSLGEETHRPKSVTGNWAMVSIAWSAVGTQGTARGRKDWVWDSSRWWVLNHPGKGWLEGWGKVGGKCKVWMMAWPMSGDSFVGKQWSLGWQAGWHGLWVGSGSPFFTQPRVISLGPWIPAAASELRFLAQCRSCVGSVFQEQRALMSTYL